MAITSGLFSRKNGEPAKHVSTTLPKIFTQADMDTARYKGIVEGREQILTQMFNLKSEQKEPHYLSREVWPFIAALVHKLGGKVFLPFREVAELDQWSFEWDAKERGWVLKASKRDPSGIRQTPS